MILTKLGAPGNAAIHAARSPHRSPRMRAARRHLSGRKAANLKRIAALDGIRGVAIAAILVVHSDEFLVAGSRYRPVLYALCRFFFGGWLSVDLFFALSGFLITANLLKYRDRPDFWTSFYLRRGFRILPAFAAVFLAVLALLRLLEPWTHLSASVLLPALFFTENWTVLNHTEMPMLPHLWTLAVEEQFYFLWPQIVTRAGNASIFRISLSVAAGCELARIVAAAMHVDGWILYAITPTRIDGLALGAALAAGGTLPSVERLLRLYWRRAAAGAALALAVVLVAMRGVLLPNDPLAQIFAIPPAILLAVLVIHGAATRTLPRWLERVLAGPVTEYLGKRSYGLYLVHYPVMLVVWQSRAGGRLNALPHSFSADLAIAGSAILISLMLTELSWHAIEAPAQRLGRRLEIRIAGPGVSKMASA